MNLSVWRWAVVIGLIVFLLPKVSFRSDSSVWRNLAPLGFEVDDKDRVTWPGKRALGKLIAAMIVGVIALGVLWWFG